MYVSTPVGSQLLVSLYRSFDDCEETLLAATHRMKVIEQIFMSLDASESWAGIRFGVNEQTTFGRRTKVYVQACSEFLEMVERDIGSEGSGEKILPVISILLDIYLGIESVFRCIDEKFYNRRIFDWHQMQKMDPHIILRIVKYYRSFAGDAVPHLDNSILSLIFPSTDPPEKEALRICQTPGAYIENPEFTPAIWPIDLLSHTCTAAVVPGKFIEQFDRKAAPLAHGVVPIETETRTALVADLFLPKACRRRDLEALHTRWHGHPLSKR